MDLLKLVKLQEIDKRLMELESFTGDLPEQVEKAKNRLAEIQANLMQAKAELETAKKQNRAAENEIESLTDKLNKHNEQLYSVKTNKEYDAITLEIENLEKKITDETLKGVEAIEREEKFSQEVIQSEQQLAEIEKLLNEREFDLQQKLNQTATEQALLLSKRNELVPDMDRRLLANYERIRKGRNGIAIAEIDNYTCNACYATIPAQTVVEVRKMERLISCEVCGRILVLVNHFGEKKLATEPEAIAAV